LLAAVAEVVVVLMLTLAVAEVVVLFNKASLLFQVQVTQSHLVLAVRLVEAIQMVETVAILLLAHLQRLLVVAVVEHQRMLD
jgi:hypothetical protein